MNFMSKYMYIIVLGWIPKIQDFFQAKQNCFPNKHKSLLLWYEKYFYMCFCPVLSYKVLFSSRNHYTNHYIRDIRRCTMQGIEISITWFKALAWLQNINKISSGSIRKVFKIYHMMYKRHKQWKIKWVLYYKMQFLPCFNL